MSLQRYKKGVQNYCIGLGFNLFYERPKKGSRGQRVKTVWEKGGEV
jgi:hypothetical protein